MAEILAQIPVVSPTKRYNYTIEKGSTNTSAQEDGDAELIISEFDSYIFFDMDFTNLKERSDVDLTGVGDVFLTFFEGDIQIKIKNLDYIKNIEKTMGQVVFKITTNESKRIRNLKNRYFFVSTKVSLDAGQSQESCLFSGFWRAFNEAPRISFASKLASQNIEKERLQKELSNSNTSLLESQKRLKDAEEKNLQLKNDIKSMQGSIDSLVLQINAANNSNNQISAPIESVIIKAPEQAISIDAIASFESLPVNLISFVSQNSTVGKNGGGGGSGRSGKQKITYTL
jgi:hypothetical protein